MLVVFTLVIMLAVAYAYYREGVFTAFAMTVNVFLSGLIAFNFFEPIADLLDGLFYDTLLAGYEDGLVMVLIFSLVLAFFRWATNSMASSDLEYHPGMMRGGGVFFGLVAGYLTAGFLLCVLQTLPWHEHFMDFDATVEVSKPFRRLMPPDRLWLAMMSRASDPDRGPFSRGKPADEAQLYEYQFDKEGNYELRYARYRRYNESGFARPYNGEVNPKRGEVDD